MERILVREQSVDDYLTLVTRVTPLNENHIESLIIIILGSYLFVIIINGLLMNGKMLFLQINLILDFSTENINLLLVAFNQKLIHHLTFTHGFKVKLVRLVLGGGRVITAKGVGPSAFMMDD